MIEIKTEQAPKAIGPYSQGVRLGNLLFVSGQIPINPATGKVIEGGIFEQTTQVINHLESILKEGGADLTQVVRADIFLTDLANDFAVVNGIYAERFRGPVKPVRQTVEVSKLPLGVMVEISCIAYLGEG